MLISSGSRILFAITDLVVITIVSGIVTLADNLESVYFAHNQAEYDLLHDIKIAFLFSVSALVLSGLAFTVFIADIYFNSRYHWIKHSIVLFGLFLVHFLFFKMFSQNWNFGDTIWLIFEGLVVAIVSAGIVALLFGRKDRGGGSARAGRS